jgi:hypothetical protein
MFKLPGFDLTPFAIVMIAHSGDSILFGALILTLSYSFTSLKKLSFLWLTVPATIITGYLALLIPSPFALVLLYHVLCAVPALFLGFLGFRYGLFVFVNLGLNLAAARIMEMF